MVSREIVLGLLKSRLQDIRVIASTDKTLTICATWKGRVERLDSDLLLSVLPEPTP
jgi:hypothetical protein